MSDSAIQPRIVLRILQNRPAVIEAICAGSTSWSYDEDYSDCDPGDRMSEAFAASWDRVQPSASEEHKEQVLHHRNVAYLISRFIDPDNAFNVAPKNSR